MSPPVTLPCSVPRVRPPCPAPVRSRHRWPAPAGWRVPRFHHARRHDAARCGPRHDVARV
eukprot:366227-Chlamydomonas_euryale.AAC.27